MKMIMTVLAVAFLSSTSAYAGEAGHEMFGQICVLLELDDSEKEKLAVAFGTLGENLNAATVSVGDKYADPERMIEKFNAARGAFRDSVGTFLSTEQFETIQRYSSAIFYELAEDIAAARVNNYKTRLKLTDDQMTALTLVVSEELRSVVETYLIYGEGDVNASVAESMTKSLLEIREKTRAEVK